MYKTICYLTIPSIYWQIHTLFFPGQKGKPVVIGGSVQNYGIVIETCPLAYKKGIRPGMLSLHARNLVHDIQIIPPDQENYSCFIKKIISMMENFSLKWIGNSYNSFFLFLPDYFNLLSTVKELQYDIKHKWSLNTQVGLSDNKYMARLAGGLSAVNEILHIDKNNASKILSDTNIKHIPELTKDDISKLNMVGINTIHDLFRLNLYHLRFFLGDKGELLYYNYICQIKTVGETDNFTYEEIFFYNTSNNFKVITDTLKKRAVIILHDLEKKDSTIMINKIKVYIEYIDNKNLMLTKKIPEKNNIRAGIKYISFILYKFKRRVRIKKVGLYFFHTLKSAEFLLPEEEKTINPLQMVGGTYKVKPVI